MLKITHFGYIMARVSAPFMQEHRDQRMLRIDLTRGGILSFGPKYLAKVCSSSICKVLQLPLVVRAWVILLDEQVSEVSGGAMLAARCQYK